MSRVCLSVDDRLGEPWPCFAGLDTLVPQVMNLVVISTSTKSEPRATATTTTDFSRFLDGAALGTYQTDCRRRDCTCVYIHACVKTQRQERENNRSLFVLREELYRALTFAGLDALKPPVISASVAGTSAAMIPSTARSTTTDFTRVLERATLWAYHLVGSSYG